MHETLSMLVRVWVWLLVAATARATRTETMTQTMTTNTDSISESVTASLPTRTDSVSYTLGTETATVSLTRTGTETMTLPTGTATVSLTQSKTLTQTDTFSLTDTHSETQTGTRIYFSNYTTALSSHSFVEGQELRLQLATSFDTTLDLFNTSAYGTLETRLFAWTSINDADCSKYTTTDTPLYTTLAFGLSDVEAEEGNRFVAKAHVTFTAPRQGQQFVICYKHTQVDPFVRDPSLNSWLTFRVPFDEHQDKYIFASDKSNMWYYLPEATNGQYAIIQLLGRIHDFTYPPSSCGASTGYDSLLPCGHGDNLKIVPMGSSCTYERQSFGAEYYGSNAIDEQGYWTPSGLPGLIEGASAGGVGRFGTQYSNPLLDTWTESGKYGLANFGLRKESTVYTADTRPQHHAYVYVRLPVDTNKNYDICVSTLEDRIANRNSTSNSTIGSIPLWKKLYRCTNTLSCSASASQTHFTLQEEAVGWTMFDLTPGSWGTIRFDDGGQGSLSTVPTVNPIRLTESYAPVASGTYPTPHFATTNYWTVGGGDYFKIVPVNMFGETRTYRGSPFDATQMGSFPNTGCWDQGLDVPRSTAPGGYATDGQGGFVEDDSPMPVGSSDLTGDPADAQQVQDNTNGLSATYSALWLPKAQTRWHVCYRKASTPHVGYRVLPWHHDTVDIKWRHLGSWYTPSYETAPQPLVPGEYGLDSVWAAKAPPPPISWYMNDTRARSWGPIVIEMLNLTHTQQLDQRAWNYNRTFSSSDTVAETVGSALRIVRSDRPCIDGGFQNHPTIAAESTDGGEAECHNSGAFTDSTNCPGSSSDTASALTTTFYVKVPDVYSAGYRVCYRLGAWNWRAVEPSNNYYRRQDWVPSSSSYLYPSSDPVTGGTLSMLAAEDRAGMESVFLFSDTASELSVGPVTPTSASDIFRLVKETEGCDINPTTWASEQHLADIHLSLYCKKLGSGSMAVSGLASVLHPCGYIPATRDTMCGGQQCPVASSLHAKHLVSYVINSPDIYDDIALYDHEYSNYDQSAAVVTLPPFDASGTNRYKLCFKQSGYANWLLFNETWEITPAPKMIMSYPATASMLLAGELQEFEFTFLDAITSTNRKAVPPDAIAGVYAKLVKRVPGDNDNCLSPPSSTEASERVSATRAFRVGQTVRHMEFRLVVPQEYGEHWLCVQVRQYSEDSMSWWRAPLPFNVVDNNVRWYVTAGNEPTNQGMSVVNFIRCNVGANGACDTTPNIEVFDTSPNGDAAKLVDKTHACHGAVLPYDEVTDHGSSSHIAIEGVLGNLGARGITNLGPADGPADVAETVMTLPASPDGSDTRIEYKICVRTTFTIATVTRSAWVEIAEARGIPNQAVIRGELNTKPAFYAKKSVMQNWNIDTALRPNLVIVDDAVLLGAANRGSVALGGVSTKFVKDKDTATPRVTDSDGGWGFNFSIYSGSSTARVATTNVFKLVLAGRASTRFPPFTNNGTDWKWVDVPDASCLNSPPVGGASNMESCTEDPTRPGECPSLTTETSGLKASFQMPIESGKFIVCYRLTEADPWLWLKAGDTNSYFLYTQPSFLEFDATDTKNITMYDVRLSTSYDGFSAASMASWCSPSETPGTGVPCMTQNNAGRQQAVTGFYTDLVTVIPEDQICTRPPVPTVWGEPPTGWYNLIRVNNASARIWQGTSIFELPPSQTSVNGMYKVCLYKAGEPAFGIPSDNIDDNSWVAKAGVMYQVFNKVLKIGFWSNNVQPTLLDITSLHVYNSSVRFMVYDPTTTQTLYEHVTREVITEPLSGHLSHTPILRSGSTISVVVKPATLVGTLPFGAYSVWVEICDSPSSWSDLRCKNPVRSDISTGFVVQNLAGACTSSNGVKYGWGSSGMRQFLDSGLVTFRLQYRSACTTDFTNNAFGCGLRFAAQYSPLADPIYSNPLWVNVESHWPDALQMDGIELLPAIIPSEPKTSLGCTATSQRCYVKTCYHGEPCNLHIQARYLGPIEFAPNGSLNIEYSVLDYEAWQGIPNDLGMKFVTNSWKELKGQVWNQGGWFDYKATPYLEVIYDEGYVFFNVSFALNDFLEPATTTSWVRAVIHVKRRIPKSIRISDVTSLDLKGLSGASTGRSPAQVWFAEPGPDTFTKPSSTLTAMPGSYVESLLPYELSYVVCPDDNDPCAHPMKADIHSPVGSWTLSAVVRGQDKNKVLQTWHDTVDGNVVFSDKNLRTSPAYSSAVLAGVTLSNMGVGAGFRQWFRIENNIGCSRFNTPPGCTIEFTFQSGATRLTAELRTPVRVVAQSLKIQGVNGAQVTAVSSITAGIVATVIPGTPMGGVWLPDEFHYGSIFAMITDSNEGTSRVQLMPHDGTLWSNTSCTDFSPDGMCLVWKYEPTKIENLWAARWTLRTTKPCVQCDFSFHSTWGASPESFTPSQSGFVSLTFTDDTYSIECTLNPEAVNGIDMPAGSVVSERFSVTVEPKNIAGQNVLWPQWWVFSDFSKDVKEGDMPFLVPALRKDLVQNQTISAHMRPVTGGTAAVFDNLFFQGEQPLADLTNLKIFFHSIRMSYDTDLQGTILKNTMTETCSVDVKLRKGVASPPTKFIKVIDVNGATAMCNQTEGCTKWYSTPSGSGSLAISVWFYREVFGNIVEHDPTDRNITARIPAGQATAIWTCSGISAPCSTEATKLRSPDENEAKYTGKSDGAQATTYVYTFGAPSVKLIRPSNSQGVSAAEGKGIIAVEQQGAVESRPPVKGATLSICATKLGSNDEVDTAEGWKDNNPCVDIKLWIIPTSAATMHTAIFKATLPSSPVPGTHECGKGATRFDFKVITYYTIRNDPLRYIVYHKPIEYSVLSQTVGAQTSNLLADATDTRITSKVLTVRNALPKDISLEDALQSGAEMRGTFSFYGLEERAVPTQFTFSATNLASPDETIASTNTSTSVKWTMPTMTPYTVWEVMDRVTYDDECPKKRYLSVTTLNYRTYANTPGIGWGYASDGAAVGIPFPIQTVVKTATVDGQTVSPAIRAWAFSPSLVTVKKRLWSGCNDGGDVIVHAMLPSTNSIETLLLPTVVQPAFVAPGTPGTVLTNRGVATSWIEFTAPCQSCILEFNLCFTTATNKETCFQDGVNDVNQYPVFAERTKLTKPFSIEKPKVNNVHVIDDVNPTPAADGTVAVGQLFKTTFEAVQNFGKWSMPVAGTTQFKVWVTSRWSHPSPRHALDASHMKYGSGGFLSTGLATTVSCDVKPEDINGAWRKGASLFESSSKLTYFFTRPCSRCEIWFYFEIYGSTGVHSGSFPQRSYGYTGGLASVGSISTYKIVTCGQLWLLAGIPPVAVRRRKAFSLTAWRVDNNNIPSWEGSNIAHLRLDDKGSNGNGGGGQLAISSPTTDVGQTTAANGTTTIRLSLPRACYKCLVHFAVSAHYFTVLTDPTQVVAIPMHNGDRVQLMNDTNTAGNWEFEVYTADDLGDRAFTSGGPTPLPWLPLYSQNPVEAVQLGVVPPSVSNNFATVTTIIVNGKRTPLTVTPGRVTASISSGSSLYNGAPHGETADPSIRPGVAVLELSGDPAPSFDIQFTLNNQPFPTNVQNEMKAPVAVWTLEPNRFALNIPEQVDAKQGGVLDLQVVAIGQKAGSGSNSTLFYRSVAPVGGVAHVTIDCVAGCPGCRLSKPQATGANVRITVDAEFIHGVAAVPISISDLGSGVSSGICSILVTSNAPEFTGADPQTSTLTVASTTLSKWTWAPSHTFTPLGNPSSPSSLANVRLNSTVELHLQAWDADFNPESTIAGVQGGVSALQFSTNPTGCFICTAGCLPRLLGGPGVPPYSSLMVVDGFFTSISGSLRCQINDAQNLPPGTILVQSLSVSIQQAVGVEIVFVDGPELLTFNFSGLTARTTTGDPAMVVGRPAHLTLRVVDNIGDTVKGDVQTVFTLVGSRVTPNFTDSLTLTETANGGVVAFKLNVSPTRALECTNEMAAAEPCTQYPWTFAIAAVMGSEMQTVAITNIGPLFAVVEADSLNVEIRPNLGSWKRVQQGVTIPWVWGYPFALKVSAVDAMLPPVCESITDDMQCLYWPTCAWGVNCTTASSKDIPRKLHVDDKGHAAAVHFRSVSIPCYGFDTQTVMQGDSVAPWLEDTCTATGKCQDTTMPECGTNGWLFKGASDAQSQELKLLDGSILIDPIEYVGGVGHSAVSRGTSFFMLTTSDLSFAPYVFKGRVLFQKIHNLRVVGSGIQCTGEHCTLPRDVFPLVTRPGPVTPLTYLPRVPSKFAFDFSVKIVDQFGEVVRGDNVSLLMLVIECHDTQFAAERFFSAGIVGGIQGNLINTPEGWDVKQAVNGVVTFSGIGFKGVCPNTSFTVVCNMSLENDPHGACYGKKMVSEVFEVGDTSVQQATTPPTNVPVVVTGLPRLQLNLGQVSVQGFGNAEKSAFEKALLHGLIRESGRHINVYLRYLCSLTPADAASGITEVHKANSSICLRWDRTASVLGNVCITDCQAAAEVEVDVVSADGVNDNTSPIWQDKLAAYTVRVLNDSASQIKQLYPSAKAEVTLVRITSAPTAAPPVTLEPTSVPTFSPATPAPSVLSPIDDAPRPVPVLSFLICCILSLVLLQ